MVTLTVPLVVLLIGLACLSGIFVKKIFKFPCQMMVKYNVNDE